jgi:striatin 1/3/4
VGDAENPNRKQWSHKLTLKNHIDSVRAICFLEGVMVTASEDCLVKLWDLEEMESQIRNERVFLDSYFTLRGHTGPIFTIAGHERRLFSAGVEGFIKTWKVPLPNEVNMYGPSIDIEIQTELWQAHSEPIWGLSLDAAEMQLLSFSSDNTIKLWDAASDE